MLVPTCVCYPELDCNYTALIGSIRLVLRSSDGLKNLLKQLALQIFSQLRHMIRSCRRLQKTFSVLAKALFFSSD